MPLSRPATGALIGAAIALTWLTFDTGAVAILVALSTLGALIGRAVDNPERMIAVLERLAADRRTTR